LQGLRRRDDAFSLCVVKFPVMPEDGKRPQLVTPKFWNYA